MKPNRTYLFIAISSVALVIVLIIQVNWIYQTAKIKEELFNEKANLVLSQTAEALSSDSIKNIEITANGNEKHKIDSLLNHYMIVYNIHLNYYFEVAPLPSSAKIEIGFANTINQQLQQQDCYQTCIGQESDKNKLQLKVVFPNKKEFIKAEMGKPFIASVVLILVVLIISWRTILSLMKEKKISEHTTDFLNNMTHEFKTPLTNIALAGKMIIKDSGAAQEEKIKHYTGIILEENE